MTFMILMEIRLKYKRTTTQYKNNSDLIPASPRL